MKTELVRTHHYLALIPPPTANLRFRRLGFVVGAAGERGFIGVGAVRLWRRLGRAVLGSPAALLTSSWTPQVRTHSFDSLRLLSLFLSHWGLQWRCTPATGIEKVVEDIEGSIPKVEWDFEGIHYFDNGPLTVQYLFVLDALNFCFWPGMSRIEPESLRL